MIFNKNGKLSRAWWLNVIKTHGHEGARGIGRATLVQSYVIRDAIQQLESTGYIDIAGKTGQGFRPTYSLTTLGHRYLNENQAELEKAVGLEPVLGAAIDLGQEIEKHHNAVDSGKTYGVPVNPTSIFEKPVDNLPVQAVHEPMQEIIEPLEDVSPNITLRDAFREVLCEILIERFGDQVAATEVIERLEAQV